jgi:hypothetical protein
MISRSAECASNPPVLTPSLLSRIQRLNLEYLQLLLEPPLPGTCVHDESLSQVLLRSLRGLSPQALQAIAAAPYALYTLGFEDQELWLDMLGTAAMDGVAGESARESRCVADDGATGCHVPRHAAFAQSVIFFAWHIAVINPLAARVTCGLPEAVCSSLQAASFGRLQALMRTRPWLLMPRWSGNPRFWPDLIKFATAGDPRAILHTQLLGHQLIACDLRLAETPPPELAGRLRAARSAQLQRWKLRPPG